MAITTYSTYIRMCIANTYFGSGRTKSAPQNTTFLQYL